jgi:hypothetical protein
MGDFRCYYLNAVHFVVVKIRISVLTNHLLRLKDLIWPKFELVSYKSVVAECLRKLFCHIDVDFEEEIFLPDKFHRVINLLLWIQRVFICFSLVVARPISNIDRPLFASCAVNRQNSCLKLVFNLYSKGFELQKRLSN